MKIKIDSVEKKSPAHKAGVRDGDILLSINGEEILDFIDYEALASNSELDLCLERAGEPLSLHISNKDYAPLGLSFTCDLMYKTRSCKNKCIFCFIDQMKRGGRDTLHVKDDDWRYSLVMGNYVTLTNVDDGEFERILRRKASPLYISVHSTDPTLRKTIMGNPSAGRIMERLRALHANGLKFHSQIVLCPTINDGESLINTINDLYSLYPSAQSVAVVPVGLTRYREGLYPLRRMTQAEAQRTLDDIHALERRFLNESGTRFVFASDEMYILAGYELPKEEEYEYYPQIENGVGLLRRFEGEMKLALSSLERRSSRVSLCAAVGEAAYAFMSVLMRELEPYNIFITLFAIKNDYFGGGVTVTGLLTAPDIVRQVKCSGMPLLIPDNMLRANEDVFLSGHDLKWLADAAKVDVHAINALDGFAFVEELIKIIEVSSL